MLLLLYVGVTWYSLRRHKELHHTSDDEDMEAWSLKLSLGVLAVATVVTAVVAEMLTARSTPSPRRSASPTSSWRRSSWPSSATRPSTAAPSSSAARGKIKLAAEIALASGAQVAVFLIPAVALLVLVDRPLALEPFAKKTKNRKMISAALYGVRPGVRRRSTPGGVACQRSRGPSRLGPWIGSYVGGVATPLFAKWAWL